MRTRDGKSGAVRLDEEAQRERLRRRGGPEELLPRHGALGAGW
jgi:hypothetical protein